MVSKNRRTNTTRVSCNGFLLDRNHGIHNGVLKNSDLTRILSDSSVLKWDFAENASKNMFTSRHTEKKVSTL